MSEAGRMKYTIIPGAWTVPGFLRAALLLVAASISIASEVHAQLRWEPVNPGVGTASYWSVVHSNGVFVAVGDAGAIAVSADGKTWQPVSVDADDAFRSVIAAQGHFLAATESGSLFISDDGVNWTHHSESGATFRVFQLAYGAGTYVLAGENGTVLTSADSLQWQLGPQSGCGFGDSIHGGRMVYGDGRFVSAGGCLQSSTDGVTWTRQSMLDLNYGLEFAGGQFIAVGSGGQIATSPDGLTWTSVPNAYGVNLFGVAHGNGRYVTIGELSSTSPVSGSSTDGGTWGFQTLDYALSGNSAFTTLRSIASGNGRFVAVGEGGCMLWSDDGVDWVNAVDDLPGRLNAATFGSGTYVAVGQNGVLSTSTNGVDWASPPPIATEDLFAVIHAGGRFVAAGADGRILTSTDSSTWQPATTSVAAILYSIDYDGTAYAAVGSSGTILTSPDAASWTSRSSGTQRSLRSVTHGLGLFVAVGDDGTIVSSADGIAWSIVAVGSSQDRLHSVAFGNGQFVAMGDSGVVRYSSDGVTWSSSSQTFYPTYALEFEGGQFRTETFSFQGLGPTGFVSPDWHAPSITQLTIRGLSFGNAGAVAVGDSGTKLHSVNGSSWQVVSPAAPNRISRLTGVTSGNGKIVAVGIDFSGDGDTRAIVVDSIDGTNWTPVPIATQGILSGIAFGNGKFVASETQATPPATFHGFVRVLESGVWETRDTGLDQALQGIARVNDRFIVLASSGYISTSTDSVSWGPQVLPNDGGTAHAAAYGAGAYVVATSKGLTTSSDAVNWTLTDSGAGYQHVFETIAFGSGRFLAGAGAGFAISPDGQSWTHYCDQSFIQHLYFDGTKFVGFTGTGVSPSPSIHPIVSFDGLEWRRGVALQKDPLYAATLAAGTHVAVGEFGAISRSLDDLVFSSGFDGLVCPQ